MQLGFLPTSRKDKEGLRRLQQEDGAIIRALEASRKIAWSKVNIQLLVPPTFLRLTRGII